MLVYDPLQTSVGKGAFKAFRLTQDFIEKFKAGKEEGLAAPVPSSDVFEEVPLKIVNSVLVRAPREGHALCEFGQNSDPQDFGRSFLGDIGSDCGDYGGSFALIFFFGRTVHSEMFA